MRDTSRISQKELAIQEVRPTPLGMAQATTLSYVTPAELAARYHVSKRTILYWLEQGTITAAFRRGKVIRFNVEDVDRQLIATEGAASGKA